LFQTEIIHFIQSFANPLITAIMIFITGLGYEEFLAFFLITFLFGINFKKGFYLVHIVLITGIITEFFKQLIAYPRPYAVDSGIKLLGKNIPNNSRFLQKGAKGFFQLLPEEVVQYYRSVKNPSFGIPSGHTSTAVTLWTSIILLYKNKYVRILSAFLILLIPLSRMYLGLHFLAGVLGGYVLGAVILIVIYRVSFKYDFFYSAYPKNTAALIYLLGFPILLQILIPGSYTQLQGGLLGFNAAFVLLKASGLPVIRNSLIKRIANVILALVTFSICSLLVSLIFSAFGNNHFNILIFLKFALITFAGLYLTSIISIKTGLMQRNN